MSVKFNYKLAESFISEEEVKKISSMTDIVEISFEIKDNLIPLMDALRKVVDEAEVIVGSQYWPYPSYADMLFYI